MNGKEFVKKYWLVGVIAGVAGYIIYKKVQKQKIYDDLMKELAIPTQRTGTIEDESNKAFSETYWKTHQPRTSLLKLTTENAKYWAAELKKALKGADDEDRIYYIYNKIPSKVEMSQIASVYKTEYGKNLFSEFSNQLTAKEQKKLNDIIKSKPDATYKT